MSKSREKKNENKINEAPLYKWRYCSNNHNKVWKIHNLGLSLSGVITVYLFDVYFLICIKLAVHTFILNIFNLKLI